MYACCVHAQDSFISSLLPAKAKTLCNGRCRGRWTCLLSFIPHPSLHHVLFPGWCARVGLSGGRERRTAFLAVAATQDGLQRHKLYQQAAFFCTEVCSCCPSHDLCCSTFKPRAVVLLYMPAIPSMCACLCRLRLIGARWQCMGSALQLVQHRVSAAVRAGRQRSAAACAYTVVGSKGLVAMMHIAASVPEFLAVHVYVRSA